MKKKLLIIIPIVIIIIVIGFFLNNNNNNNKAESPKKEYIVRLENDIQNSGYVVSVIPNNIVDVVSQRNVECEEHYRECDIVIFKLVALEEGSTYVRFIKGRSFDNINESNTITYRVDVDEELNIKVTKSEFIDETHSFDEEFIK